MLSFLEDDFLVKKDVYGQYNSSKVKPDFLLFPKNHMFQELGFPKAVLPLKILSDYQHKSYMAAFKLSYKYLRSTFVVNGKLYKPQISLIFDPNYTICGEHKSDIEMTIAYLDIFMLRKKGKVGYEVVAGQANYFRRQDDYQGTKGKKSMSHNYASLVNRLN